MQPLLRVSGLAIDYAAARGETIHALRGVDLEVHEGETFCISGDSGCGKSTLSMALLRLLPENAVIVSGRIEYGGRDLLKIPQRDLRKIRGGKISLISQEPALALNPALTAGAQIAEVLRAHPEDPALSGKAQLRRETHEILRAAGLDEPERIARSYPHQLSGGQRQRVALAQALVCRPSLLIADEPFSSLDAVTQTGLLDLLRDFKKQLGLAILLITHDEALVSSSADRAAVMREGRLAARCPREPQPERDWRALLGAAGHDSVRHDSVSQNSRENSLDSASSARGRVLLQIRGLRKRFVPGSMFSRKRSIVHALEGVDVTVSYGDIIAIAGRSGSGKSTLARCIAGLETPDGGEALLDGVPVGNLSPALRREIQLIFQDAPTSLNPGFTAEQLIAEPLEMMRRGPGPARQKRVADLMREVGLDPNWRTRRTTEFSGGERQRLAIARALAANPRLLLLDEALTGLDPPLQVQMARLFLELRSRHALAYLYISHDLNFVSWFAHEVLIMSQGKIVDRLVPGSAPGDFRAKDSPEDGSPAKDGSPARFHPETRALLEASRRLHAAGMWVAR